MASEKDEKEQEIKTPKTKEGEQLGKVLGAEFKELKLGDKAGKAVFEATVAETGPLAPVLGWATKKAVDKVGEKLVEKGVGRGVDKLMQKLDEHQKKEQTHNGPLRDFTNQLIQKGSQTLQPKVEKAVAEAVLSTGVSHSKSKDAGKAASDILQKVVASTTGENQPKRNAALPEAAKDGTYTMKQLCACIDAAKSFMVEKVGASLYSLSIPPEAKGSALNVKNPGKFPIEIKLAADEEHYRQALDSGKIEIGAFNQKTRSNGEVKVLAQSKQREANQNARGGR